MAGWFQILNPMRTRCFLILLILLSATAFADLPVTKGLYVGAVAINPSQDAKILADWYARLGITTMEIGGGYYAKLDTAAGTVAFAIHPRKPDAPAKAPASIAITFHVEDFDASLAAAKVKGLAPDKVEIDPFGRFAHFHDPDGNAVTLWGR